MKRFLSKLTKKGFTVELDEFPKSEQEYLEEIERYCMKEKVTYTFIERKNPAIISINNVIYKCEGGNSGRPGYVLHFKEI